MCTIKQASQPSDARQYDIQHHDQPPQVLNRQPQTYFCSFLARKKVSRMSGAAAAAAASVEDENPGPFRDDVIAQISKRKSASLDLSGNKELLVTISCAGFSHETGG